ncbi:hemolysin family protein [Thiohalobacter thiocyanaticus]|uniref:HlyC/CorC family transporter n=1 Tax=Thiohalobacter thiocyanaticus TaxID=585455 RepID=A0A426QIK7_9GAMM|nr:hemolysin family protein [Thiohalobacter thiocyanaticus]RRQ21578.1 HlyC/CorC family transporter [Thiohalobacter thiocyanaticus]
METFIILLAMVLLLLLEGFFSGSEIALVHAEKVRLHAEANKGNRGARLVLDMFQRPDILLTTTLVGTNISVVTLTTLGTLLMIRLFGEYGDIYGVLIYAPLFLIIGEIVPKSVYQQHADHLAPRVIYPLRVFKILLYPVILTFSSFARLAARLAGENLSEKHLFITRQQIGSIVEMANRSAHVGVFDKERISRAVRFADTSVGDAMRPVAELVAVDGDNGDMREAFRLVGKYGYNRLPVYQGNIGNIIGILTLTVWDLMEGSKREQPLPDLVQPALYVSPLQNVVALMPQLKEREDSMAIVVDEFGSAIGMITMEDIMEEVVGEIRVGYDFDEYRPRRRAHYRRLGDGSYEVDSRLSVGDVNELLDTDLPTSEAHTIGGLVEARLRHIPAVGESITREGWTFTVTEASERAVVKLRISTAADAPDSS